MKKQRFISALCSLALLSSCGGGGGSSGGGGTSVTPTPSSSATACSLADRQSWVLAQLKEWYLFPDLIDNTVNPAAHTSIDTYIDALVAPARAQSKDRYFTYITSIAQENAFFNSGSTAGFGVRLSYDATNRRLFVLEAYEGAPALAAGIDRGAEITDIGDTPTTMQSVQALFLSGGSQAVSAALGPADPGVTRTLRIRQNGADSVVTVSKANYSLQPVSPRYGTKVIDNGGQKVGYINLRTFIDTADPQLRAAFDSFRAQGITNVIVDLRYNGGGLVSIAALMGDLLNAGRGGQVWSYTTFRAEKAANNSTNAIQVRSEAIGATKVAFIGTGASASASELVINGMTPYLGANSALVGSNTYGKPVGQIGLDRTACDDRFRVIAFRTENASHLGDYYTGLASKVAASCAAPDDITKPLGDPNEASVKSALDFLAGRTCAPITASGGGQTAQSVGGGRALLTATKPSASQFELNGLF